MAKTIITNNSSDSGIGYDPTVDPPPIDPNFRPMKIRVFKNGNDFDNGIELTMTKKEFKHWISFLDALTKKLETTTPVHKIFTVEGVQVNMFESLQPDGWYVAVTTGPFQMRNYGGALARRRAKMEKGWKPDSKPRIAEKPPPSLDDPESIDIYLSKQGYMSKTGRTFFDAAPKSPTLQSRAENFALRGSRAPRHFKAHSGPSIRPGRFHYSPRSSSMYEYRLQNSRSYFESHDIEDDPDLGRQDHEDYYSHAAFHRRRSFDDPWR